jgi:hypothetical protein
MYDWKVLINEPAEATHADQLSRGLARWERLDSWGSRRSGSNLGLRPVG